MVKKKKNIFTTPRKSWTFDDYTNSEIRRHDSNPSVAGNRLPRIPEWRAKFQSLYHIKNNWDAMVAGRYQDKAFGQIDNSDILSGDNAQSEYFFLDFKINCLNMYFG